MGDEEFKTDKEDGFDILLESQQLGHLSHIVSARMFELQDHGTSHVFNRNPFPNEMHGRSCATQSNHGPISRIRSPSFSVKIIKYIDRLTSFCGL